MKTFRALAMLLLCMGLLFSTSSCAVFVTRDNGHHRGWHKNPNNPHHSYSTNPGKSKGSYKNQNNPHHPNSTNPGKSKGSHK